MSNISNISRQIAKLSDQLADARSQGNIPLAEQLEDELNDLEDELEDAEEAGRGNYNWS